MFSGKSAKFFTLFVLFLIAFLGEVVRSQSGDTTTDDAATTAAATTNQPSTTVQPAPESTTSGAGFVSAPMITLVAAMVVMIRNFVR
uniref:Uncharacterized protein n=1 Tax=Ciona intestinalis TaxID=7719 RepID=H2XVA4_CIOIN